MCDTDLMRNAADRAQCETVYGKAAAWHGEPGNLDRRIFRIHEEGK